jgi:hypothetical protein
MDFCKVFQFKVITLYYDSLCLVLQSKLDHLRNKHIFLCCVLSDPVFNKQIICFDFEKQNSAQPI